MNSELTVSKYGKYGYKEDFFSVINTEQKAYWLGFLYADGAISQSHIVMSLALKYSDKKHLKNLRDLLCPSKPIMTKYVKLGDKIHKACRVDFSCKRLVESLIKNGCTPRKSLTLKFPSAEQVPNQLIRHFIRGYFDGDGCVCNNNCSVLSIGFEGTRQLLQAVQQIFIAQIAGYTTTKVIRTKKQKSYNFRKSGRVCCSAIFRYLYEDANVYLPRKYKKFLELLKINDLPFLQATEERIIAELNGKAEMANPGPKTKYNNLVRLNAYKVKLYLENINFARGRNTPLG